MFDTPITYSVLGGCTTRDAAELGSNPLPKPIHYFSRTRIQSIVSSPSPIDESAIPLKSNYQRRVIVEDHDKSVARTLTELNHPLVIDLIGERSPLMRTPYGIITASQYYNQAGLEEHHDAVPVPEDRDLTEEGPFAMATREFAALLTCETVVIHRAFWATADLHGQELQKRPLAEKSNAWLDRAYKLLEVALGDRAVPIEVPAAHRVADPSHKWGPAPFHFPASYYDELSALIRDSFPKDRP